jgi:DNA ligase-1
MKPMRATDAVESKMRFPAYIQPKIDGVRGCHLNDGFTSRTLKKHGNKFTTQFFSNEIYKGLDGELAAELWTHDSLCRLTTSAVSTIAGEPFVLWWTFDYITPETIKLPYRERYAAMSERLRKLHLASNGWDTRLRLVPSYLVGSLEEYNAKDAEFLDQGFEGSIYRDPAGMHKEGYSTVREGGLLRVKRFVEKDAVVLRLVEGEENTNEATIGASGYTERSTHKANMIPNGMVGALICKDIESGQEITVAAGKMTHDERRTFWEYKSMLVGATIKYKTFPRGVKDKPRFPTFQALRADSDLS